MAEQREETAQMIQRALNDPAYLTTLRQVLTPEPPAVPQLGSEHIIEGEILYSEEIKTPKKENPNDNAN